MSTDLQCQYSKIINKTSYGYYFTITFKEEDYNENPLNFDEDPLVKKFLLKLHRFLFGKHFIKNNLFLDIVLVRESHISNNNDHFHGLIKSSPHDISFLRLIKGFQYATSKLYVTTRSGRKLHVTSRINNRDIPELTFNHHQNKYTVDPSDYSNKHSKPLYDILPKHLATELQVNSNDHSFPHNLRPIETKQDQEDIVDYILKATYNNTDHIAFIQPDRSNDYFNFTTKI